MKTSAESFRHRPATGRLVLLLAALPLVLAAQAPDGAATGIARDDLVKLPKPRDLRPTGPVTLTSDKAELVQGNSAIYTGNVVLSSDTLKLEGDRVELTEFPGGQYLAKITGAPAQMNHAGAGSDNPPVAARARTLNYDSRDGVLELLGDAFVMRGKDEINGDTIRYNVGERRIQASGGSSGQVRIILQPRNDAAEPASADPASTPGAP